MTKKVIINADDFGMSEAYNYGVIKALRDGVASSTTIMINQPAAEHAVSLLKEVPGTYVGLHVNLTTGSPVSDPDKIPSLVKPNGEYIGSKDFKTHKKQFVYKDCYIETKAQVERFREFLVKLKSNGQEYKRLQSLGGSVKQLLNRHLGLSTNHNYR